MHFMETKRPGTEAPHTGLARLLGALPAEAGTFAGSEYAEPVAMACLGAPVDLARLRQHGEKLLAGEGAAAAAQCETALVAAEAVESACADRAQYFIADAKARDLVFMGSKWRAGWVCLVGEGPHDALAAEFQRRGFYVFCRNGAGVAEAVDLGPRETGSVYFVQLMVRYAMIWGRIAPGNPHEMGHFLEVDLPGVVVASGALGPVEELLLLGLMKLGAPAVVPPGYPFEQGRQVRAEGLEAVVEAAVRFPNLRVREVGGETVALPDYCDPARSREEIEVAQVYGGAQSFFVLGPKSAGSVCDGVSPEAGAANVGVALEGELAPGADFAVVVCVGDENLDVSTSLYLEDRARRGIAMLQGLRPTLGEDGAFRIEAAAGARVRVEQIGGAVRAALRGEFPLLRDIEVRVITDPAVVARERPRALAFVVERARLLASEADDNVDYFHYCIECQPFSREHVCIVSPDRPPMCGRDRFQIKTAALFGATWHPYKRLDVPDGAMRGAIAPGVPLDADAGEYAAVNEATHRLSRRAIERVTLHSVRRAPHSSCGCFQFLAFWSDAIGGIGVMERNYAGAAPGGETWNALANRAGGKQSEGVTGVSGAYLRSPRFLRGDGGHAAVRWLSPRAFAAMREWLPDPAKVGVGE